MTLSWQIEAELERRRRKREGITLTAPAKWDKWLTTLFPKHFDRPFAPRHVQLWNWIDGIKLGIRPRPFVGIWGRGGAKSTNAEAGAIRLASKDVRKYAWYISSTQDKADNHVASVGAMLEGSETNKYYPDLANRAVNKFGHSKGWRRERLRTASGFTIDALGLDTGARGSKIDEQRPDLIIIDDVDELHDSAPITLKKINTLTQTIFPAGSIDCAILFIQNVIHPESIAARLSDGRADFLMDRILSGPFPAVDGLEYETRVEINEDGLKESKFYITHGVPTWVGQDLETCQHQINTWGLKAFLKEAQHDVDRSGGIWDHIEFMHVEYDALPPFVRTAVWVDPAVTSKDGSDSQGISAGGITKHKKVVGLFWWEGIASPEAALERAIEKAIEIRSIHVGVETDQGGDTWKSVYIRALQKVKDKLKKQLTAEQYNSIVWPRFTSRKAGGTDETTGHAYGPKVERNAKMLVDYEHGNVSHMIGTNKVIEKALYRFAKPPLDVADSWFWCWHDLKNPRLVTAM